MAVYWSSAGDIAACNRLWMSGRDAAVIMFVSRRGKLPPTSMKFKISTTQSSPCGVVRTAKELRARTEPSGGTLALWRFHIEPPGLAAWRIDLLTNIPESTSIALSTANSRRRINRCSMRASATSRRAPARQANCSRYFEKSAGSESGSMTYTSQTARRSPSARTASRTVPSRGRSRTRRASRPTASPTATRSPAPGTRWSTRRRAPRSTSL